MPDLPSGTVTFLFTDVEGSTKLLHELGPGAYADALAQHRRIVRKAVAAHGGVEVDTQGDAFFIAFPTAQAAAEAATALTESLSAGPISVRAGLHTGAPLLTEEGYVGDDVHLAARIAASGHGGQVILSSAAAALVQLPLTELGEHRFKDIAEAVPIFQLGNGEFPPLRTISNTNLPRPASSFVGREAELRDVLARIEGGARLVTLTGPGGSGKTRLAIEAAATRVPLHRAGVFWVGLAALRDPGLVPETISQVLGAKDGLAEHIGEREMLRLLDNLEQVIEAAPALSSLLGACPNLTLLVTSRELLRVQGEVEYPVPPLAMPEAISLFCARAQVQPSDEIAELCARLDSLPLAVELAAARTKAISPAQILERLGQRLDLLRGGRDTEARQQTLRATIEWSYELLPGSEQELFARLAVFAGGCTLQAAEEIIGADLDILQSLVEKSLIRFSNERYWMLETIREYAAERFAASGQEEALRDRHAEWFLALATEAQPFVERAWLRGRAGAPGAWLDRLEMELDNIRSALARLRAVGRTRDALRMAAALDEFWFMNEHSKEAAQLLRPLLKLHPEPTRERAKALLAWANSPIKTGDEASALAACEEALAISRALDDPAGVANAQWGVGVSLSMSERYEDALPHLEASIALFSELGDDDLVLGVGWPLVWTLEESGRRERAWNVRHDLLRRARETGNTAAQMRMLGGLSINALDLGKPAREALSFVHDHLPLALGEDRETIAIALSRCASVLARTANIDPATQILAGAEALFDELEYIERWVRTMNEDTVSVIRGHLDTATFAEAYARGRAMPLDGVIELAMEATSSGRSDESVAPARQTQSESHRGSS
ncbi:MAG TPA: adenylate/guanylate cyclase domain-containing protein [Pleomorphomonadaceae bacterium]|nr:adenylate/guanylate cyclase domain-containing protein [Pleomorphomonadaceae bacterium]